MTYTLKLPLVEDYYEGEYPVAFASRDPRPALMIFRASIQYSGGTRRLDHKVEEYVACAKAEGYKYGLYHFLTPSGIAEQAALFLGLWNKVGGSPTRPIVDVEINPGLSGVGQAVWQGHIKTFLDLIEKGTGKVPMIYTSRNYWGYTYTNSQPPAWTANYPLWVAWYPYQPDNYAAPAASIMPGGWSKWALWQYNDAGRTNGYKANDMNVASDWFMQELGSPPAADLYKQGWNDALAAVGLKLAEMRKP